jgi:DNA invertase Pin-like site-specific DNA recombinase
MVWAVDRLGRSLADLFGSMQELHSAKVDLFIHQNGVGPRNVRHAGHVLRIRAGR